ncbi:MAG: CBS domain-containing protein [Acidobacteria bacterium]|nr:CBS domain-containing protein [Acidobacteriota bacterium]
MQVREIMTGDVKSCRPETDVATAATIMWEQDCGCVPVTGDDGRVIGMITDRDICMAVATRLRLARDISVGEVISGKVHACAPDDEVKDALRIMQGEKLHRLPVLDGEGKLTGILSLNDLVRHAKKGGGKRHVSHSEVMATLKSLSQHRTSPPMLADSREGQTI